MFLHLSVILSTGGGGCLADTPSADTPLGRQPLGRHPQTETPQADTPPQQTGPPAETAAAVNGTHPTGMHSCLIWFFVMNPILSDLVILCRLGL